MPSPVSSQPLADVVSVLIEHVPASSRPSEATPGDVVYDVGADEDVHLAFREPAQALLTVTRRGGRPETAQVLGVSLTGAETLSDDAEALVLTGVQFARGNAWKVTATLVRG